MHEAFPSARFLVAGDGQEDGGKTLDAIGADKGLRERFEFLGRVSDADKARFYRSLSMYVAPQTGGESFGIVLAEAMAAGCPSSPPTSMRSGPSPRRGAVQHCSSIAMRMIAHAA